MTARALAELPAPTGEEPDGTPEEGWLRSVLRAASFRNASALYIWAAIVVLFSIWVPETFLNPSTWQSLLDTQVITALVAVGLCFPLAAGVFDLSVGLAVGMGSMVVSVLLVRHGLPIPLAILLALVVGLAIGLVNGLIVTVLKVDSFIATLGVQSVLIALVTWISGGIQILGLPSGFQELAASKLFGVTYPVYFLLLVAIVAWYVLERTPLGRRFYATGGNLEATRLAGVRTSTLIVASLVISAGVAALAGMLVAARLGTGDPSVGPEYLLPAFSAAFLGSTQFRSGRFNIWGTVVSVYVLATGVKGLQLAGAPVWLPALFNGLVLIAAVALSKVRARRAAGGGSAGSGTPSRRRFMRA
jgi:ribose transport system permease protein